MRPISNRYVDGFDLELSARFGVECVLLQDEKQAIRVSVGVKKALIELHFKNCQPRQISTETGGTTYRRTETKGIERATTSGTRTRLGGEARVAPATPEVPITASGTLEGGFSRQTDNGTSYRNQVSRTWSAEWERAGPTSIMIGSGDTALMGQAVDSVRGWRVTIDTTQPFCGVMASLTTRAEWLDFGRIEVEGLSAALARKVKDATRNKRSRDRELFELLLKTLAEKGLRAQSQRDAMLAADVQVLRRNDRQDELGKSLPVNVPPSSPLRSIPVNMGLVEEFLDLDASKKVAFLEHQGAPFEEIQRITQMYHSTEPTVAGRLFNAGSAPPTAKEALELSRKGPMSTADWDSQNKNRSRTDLVALGLIAVVDGMVVSLVPKDVSSEDALRHAAAKAPTLIVTREILLRAPQASGVEIAEEIASRFARKYNTHASKLRVGNALRRWAIWLEPHLADPTGGSGAARLRISAKSERPGVGAPTLASPETVARLQTALNEGLRGRAAAKAAGVSRSTLYNWADQGIVNVPNKIQRKKKK